MSLSAYNKKRNFEVTAEPVGKEKTARGKLRFVIQKHDASHLHYDFRLEMEGVLKSWAVPKGPSLNASDKRLAMEVEDHPFDYRNFEGVIPEGNYGGGTVIVWDEGTYQPLDAADLTKKEQEKLLLKQLKDGSLKIMLQGEKLQGEFALFLMKGRGERSWILMKKKDEFATTKNILLQDESVKTGKTIAEVAAKHGTVIKHPDEEQPKKKEKPKAPELLPQKKVVSKTAASKKTAVKKKAAGKKKEHKTKTTVPSSKIKTSGLQINVADGIEQTIVIDKHELTITNLNKLYWKKEKFTKGDTINYYLQAAPYILPYMQGRPQSLNRHPSGIDGTSFYQKDMKGKVPGWMDTHKDFSESTGKTVEYLVCNNEATLIYMANLGCIEMHPWHSQAASWQNPDWCIIDLDPDTKNTFGQVMETALVT
ncbi:MAG: DNA polymerase ligase N-terminal domain-containing protein, partial [Bacteroidota bacterium]